MSVDFVHTALGHVDLGVWHALTPAQLASSPEMVDGYPPGDAAARALKYARVAGPLTYDEIGFRSLAVTPVKGHVPLQTFAQARLDAERERRRRSPADLDLMRAQTRKLRHRPLSAPAGQFSYTVDLDTINLTLMPDPGQPDDGIVWSFPLGAPPAVILDMADDHDEPQLYTQHSLEGGPPVHWLPLSRLIEAGQFGRMQEITTDLVSRTFPGNYYCFISHRWLTPTAPDPDGKQAGMTAWQLAAAMCEAVYVAYERGLHTPRKFLDFAQMPVGPSGSALAEALIVNVLRHTLDVAGLAAVHTEILPLQRDTADHGVRAGHTDSDLGRLRELVGAHPRLRSLLDRVYLWYDYSCLPQKPRTPADQEAFEQGLRQFELHQMLGRTAILLDDADDYLTRAWCTLEALTADALRNIGMKFDVLVGASRPTVSAGRTEHHLTTLLQDRPHVVWRALLDTELFGVQSAAECLRRLELAMTDEADRSVIYAALCRLGMPTKIHIDESEIVTGTLPLPVADRGRTVVLPTTSRRTISPADRPVSTTSLDWTAAARLEERADRAAAQPSFVEIGAARRRGCHVVVIGSCEGEAMLVADWTLTHTADLQGVAGATVQSVTWVATDIAPVGHFAEGILRTAPIDAPLWVLVAVRTRFTRCGTTAAILNAVIAAELPYVTIDIDLPGNNVRRYAPTGRTDPDAGHRVNANRVRPAEWRGGLFRVHLLGELRRAVAGERA